MTSDENIRNQQDIGVIEQNSPDCETDMTEPEVPADNEQDIAEIPESDSEPDIEAEESESEHCRYKLPSVASQTISVFALQMRQYFKGKTVFMLVAIMLFIPVIRYSGLMDFFGIQNTMPGLLTALPFVLAIIPSILAGRLLSSEFRNRTAFMMFPLPVSRSSYYFGKFLAALAVAISIFSLAYGVVIMTGSDLGIESFPSDFLKSYIICLSGIFAITATAYGLGAAFNRGSVAANVILTLVLPFLIIYLTMYLSGYIYPLVTETVMESITENVKLFPQFSGYQALYLMDSGYIFPLFYFPEGFLTTDLSIYRYLGVAAVWGTLFLALGLRKTNKKEL